MGHLGVCVLLSLCDLACGPASYENRANNVGSARLLWDLRSLGRHLLPGLSDPTRAHCFCLPFTLSPSEGLWRAWHTWLRMEAVDALRPGTQAWAWPQAADGLTGETRLSPLEAYGKIRPQCRRPPAGEDCPSNKDRAAGSFFLDKIGLWGGGAAGWEG